MKLIVNLYAVALGYLFRYATVGKIMQQHRRLQTRHFDVLKSRFLDKRRWLIRFSDRKAHLLRDVIGLPQKVRFTGHFSGKREDVATRARSKVKPQIFPWIDMERRFSLTAIWGVKPKPFAVASSRLITQLIEKLNKRDFLDVVNVHRRIFRFGLSGSGSCLGGATF